MQRKQENCKQIAFLKKKNQNLVIIVQNKWF